MTVHGIIAVKKPRGLTSHDVVKRIKRIIGVKKVGHTGTLDPEVEGVLPICVGQATRLVEYIQELPKTYRGTMIIGLSTDTEDQTGTILERQDATHIDQNMINEVFARFTGKISQVPPMYSAVKIDGKRLYKLARTGISVAREPRSVEIFRLQSLLFRPGEYPEVDFTVTCSKGTYIRTLCVDIGKKLGVPAHMTDLVRTQSGPMFLEDCYSLTELEELAKNSSLDQVILPLGEILGHYPIIMIEDEEVSHVLDGWHLTGEQINYPYLRVYTFSGKFCALYRYDEVKGAAVPIKVFREVIV